MKNCQYNIGKEIVVYGNRNQFEDLRYVFSRDKFVAYSENIEEIEKYAMLDKFILLCGKDKEKMESRLRAVDWKEGGFCSDDEKIKELNYPLQKICKEKKLYVWGTGYWCTKFEEYLQEQDDSDIKINGYIDSNSDVWGTLRNGVEILSPESLPKEDVLVVVATNYNNYVEIEHFLRDISISKENYISVHVVMDDVAGYFKRIYDAETYYPVRCKNDDRNARLAHNGNLCTCCMARQSVYGNIYLSDFDDIWNSKRAIISRLSLQNQTFVYCEKDRCPFLSGVSSKERVDLEEQKEVPAFYKQEYPGYPDSIAPEIDCSCNLHCKSCRNEVFIDTSPERDIYADLLLDKIVSLPPKLVISTVGDPFVSKNCLRVIHDEKTRQKKTIGIYSNGILLTPSVLDELLNEYETIDLSISVDAATKETYEKLRRGGKWDILQRNLSYYGKMREAGKITYLQLNYTLQADNVSEMEDFMLQAEALQADRVAMNAIENWGHISQEEYDKMAVTFEGKVKDKYMKYFTRELLENPLINFHNLSNLLNVEPKKMYMI